MKGGMGAALLSNPDGAADIIKALRRNYNVPVSAKIRLPDATNKVDAVSRFTLEFMCNLHSLRPV